MIMCTCLNALIIVTLSLVLFSSFVHIFFHVRKQITKATHNSSENVKDHIKVALKEINVMPNLRLSELLSGKQS